MSSPAPTVSIELSHKDVALISVALAHFVGNKVMGATLPPTPWVLLLQSPPADSGFSIAAVAKSRK